MATNVRMNLLNDIYSNYFSNLYNQFFSLPLNNQNINPKIKNNILENNKNDLSYASLFSNTRLDNNKLKFEKSFKEKDDISDQFLLKKQNRLTKIITNCPHREARHYAKVNKYNYFFKI